MRSVCSRQRAQPWCARLFIECEAVCIREEHLAAAGLSSAQAEAFLNAQAGFVQPVAVRFLWRPQLRDPADELVLEAAVNARADALLSFNLRHFQAAAGRLGLRLSRPGNFLQGVENARRVKP
ncbi:MAG TPA: PIN domain-containing protein [Rubrivivax sp.]|nr:PIN domain-containing protein [Rubrivivax sp.]